MTDPTKSPTTEPTTDPSQDSLDQAHISESIRDKFTDAQAPGYQAEFDPEEAERAGAFSEDALSEPDALQSVHDLPDALLEKPASPFSHTRVLRRHWPAVELVKPDSSISPDRGV